MRERFLCSFNFFLRILLFLGAVVFWELCTRCSLRRLFKMSCFFLSWSYFYVCGVFWNVVLFTGRNFMLCGAYFVDVVILCGPKLFSGILPLCALYFWFTDRIFFWSWYFWVFFFYVPVLYLRRKFCSAKPKGIFFRSKINFFHFWGKINWVSEKRDCFLFHWVQFCRNLRPGELVGT